MRRDYFQEAYQSFMTQVNTDKVVPAETFIDDVVNITAEQFAFDLFNYLQNIAEKIKISREELATTPQSS